MRSELEEAKIKGTFYRAKGANCYKAKDGLFKTSWYDDESYYDYVQRCIKRIKHKGDITNV
jgi:hypothetical protein